MNSKLLLSTLSVGALSLLCGCTVEEHTVYHPGPPPPPVYGGTTIVYDRYEAPPPLLVEVRPAPPTYYRAAWVAGHWRWDGHRYHWQKGYYRRA